MHGAVERMVTLFIDLAWIQLFWGSVSCRCHLCLADIQDTIIYKATDYGNSLFNVYTTCYLLTSINKLYVFKVAGYCNF